MTVGGRTINRLGFIFAVGLAATSCYRTSGKPCEKDSTGQSSTGGETDTGNGAATDMESNRDSVDSEESESDTASETGDDRETDLETDWATDPMNCEDNWDCGNFACCGCHDMLTLCEGGYCVDVFDICIDGACCFEELSCGELCEPISLFPDFEGTCDGEVCDLSDFGVDSLLHGCCTTSRDRPFITEEGLCGFDAALIGYSGVPALCIQLDIPGTLDDSCPDQEPSANWVDPPPGPGCCTEIGLCGIMYEEGCRIWDTHAPTCRHGP
jgi:hypothetical protein